MENSITYYAIHLQVLELTMMIKHNLLHIVIVGTQLARYVVCSTLDDGHQNEYNVFVMTRATVKVKAVWSSPLLSKQITNCKLIVV